MAQEEREPPREGVPGHSLIGLRPVEPLDYASPPEEPADEMNERTIRVFRRLLFMTGCALLAYGAGLGLRNRSDAEWMMLWGGVLLGLTLPLGRRPLR